jgi:hypothetical protein
MLCHFNQFRAKWVFLLLLGLCGWLDVGAQVQIGEITTANASCKLTLPVCNGDTIALVPTNTTNYTNFKWYYQEVLPANLITGANAGQGVVRVNADSLIAVAPGGRYILTAEYVNPTGLGCATLNDTLDLDFQTVPSLATVPDTICQADGESVDLMTRVSDANNVTGTTRWFTTFADALANTNHLTNNTVNPTGTTTYYVRKTSAGTAGCADFDSVKIVISCLSLGNQVWYDTNNDGVRDAGEAPIGGVTVNLFLDANNNGTIDAGEQTPIKTATTSSNGLYLFENLSEGAYIVGIPASQFGAGQPLQHLYTSGTTAAANGTPTETTTPPDPDNNTDGDDNGAVQTTGFYAGGVLSQAVSLNYLVEPLSESPDSSSVVPDANDNQTLDFGFYGMSLGSLVFMDTDNDATRDGGEMGIGGVTVRLYASDGVTLIASTTTDANGQYLFNNLPQGNYVVAVLSGPGTPLEGKLTSDNIASSTTPNSADNDDNGTSMTGWEVRSPTVTLTAGAAPTGESDQAATTGAGLGSPATSDNPLTPDNNSNLYVDFGFKPVCDTIGTMHDTLKICANDANGNLTFKTSYLGDIRFVRFDTPQTGNNMYTGGTNLETVTTSGTAPYNAVYTFDTADFPNTSNTQPDTFYLYAVIDPALPDPTCRPFAVIPVIVWPEPTASPDTLISCESEVGSGSFTFTLSNSTSDVLNGQTGMTVTYHNTLADANADANPITTKLATNNTVVYARVENIYGCYMTSEVLLKVNPRPAFSLSQPIVCPGENPTLQITLGSGADADPMVSVNGGTPFAYSTLTGGLVTVAQGLLPGQANSITLTNGTTCTATNSTTMNAFVPQVCIPVQAIRMNNRPE